MYKSDRLTSTVGGFYYSYENLQLTFINYEVDKYMVYAQKKYIFQARSFRLGAIATHNGIFRSQVATRRLRMAPPKNRGKRL